MYFFFKMVLQVWTRNICHFNITTYPMKKSAMARLQTRKRGTSILDLEAMRTMTTQPFPSWESRNTIQTEHLKFQEFSGSNYTLVLYQVLDI